MQHELNVTSIFVTHDQDEALDMSDRIVVMNKGQVEQIDEPSQIYHAPQTPFVTQFVGDVNAVSYTHLDDVKVVFANPKTSANGRFAYLSALAYAEQHSDKPQDFMRCV